MTGRGRTRREVLGLAGGAAALLAGGCGGTRERTGELVRSAGPLPEPFTTPLPVPRVLEPLRRTADADVHEVVQRVVRVGIVPGRSTEVFGYGGTFPGPTIVSERGRATLVTHVNELPVPTVAHLHGGHTPADSDGFPTDLLLPAGAAAPPAGAGHGGAHHEDPQHGGPRRASTAGDLAAGRREHTYPMQQRAATLWYHDHRMDFTGPAVHRGLFGLHLVRDEEEARLGLPSGAREVPLLIADRSFAEDGSFRYPALDPTMLATPGVQPEFSEGVLGDVVLVNGAAWPVLDVDAARYRFRVLNASNARRYDLRLSPPPPSGPRFVQVGSDGGLLARPVELGSVRLAPGERFDVVVDFARYPVGTEVDLVNGLGDGGSAQVLRFRVVRRARDDSTVPARLSEVEVLAESAAVRTREFRFSRGGPGQPHWVLGGRPYDPARVDADPVLGQVERWRLRSDVHHPVHVHLDPFQVVRRGSRRRGPWDGGWKDTVDVRPGEVVEVLVRFTDHAGRFVLHCHNLEHEDMMMMANFQTRA
ncbi:multicopper oxidase domain-containing protein [Kineococcus sp. T13]|uniref:multicopper oxidase domain-containing protein n=1 Tax=Kineococcus vitellinus TaxID=2696565 RepID=UPI0014120597|nr:multicopper oxidase domain-containing protein [Kineococcus vitellinus]